MGGKETSLSVLRLLGVLDHLNKQLIHNRLHPAKAFQEGGRAWTTLGRWRARRGVCVCLRRGTEDLIAFSSARPHCAIKRRGPRAPRV